MPHPSRQNRQSVVNWMDNNKPMIELEAQFIINTEDLVSLTVQGDEGLIDKFIEWSLKTFIPLKLGSLVR